MKLLLQEACGCLAFAMSSDCSPKQVPLTRKSRPSQLMERIKAIKELAFKPLEKPRSPGAPPFSCIFGNRFMVLGGGSVCKSKTLPPMLPLNQRQGRCRNFQERPFKTIGVEKACSSCCVRMKEAYGLPEETRPAYRLRPSVNKTPLSAHCQT